MDPDTNSHADSKLLPPIQALFDIVLALLLTVAAAIAAPLLGQVLVKHVGMPLLGTLMLQGVVVLAGLWVLLARRGQSWRQIGFRPLRLRDAGLGLLALLLIFALNALVSVVAGLLAPGLLEADQQRVGALAGVLTGGLSPVAIGAAMLFTGFYEEVLARGFLLSRSRALLAGVWGPVLLSSLLFGLGHFYQGPLGVLQTALVGVVFARLALHWGTLWPVIFAHAALNTISLIVLGSLVG
jgi:membrane protease YdiL (CAAX protease family)